MLNKSYAAGLFSWLVGGVYVDNLFSWMHDPTMWYFEMDPVWLWSAPHFALFAHSATTECEKQKITIQKIEKGLCNTCKHLIFVSSTRDEESLVQ